jgi:hypothetical protein
MKTRALLMCSPVAARRQGQAMVEFLVAATFFLVPLFLAIVVFGKFIDVQHTITMAARYAAWERTVWYDDGGTTFSAHNGTNHKSAAQIGNELAVRLINDRSSATVIKNSDKTATSFVNGTDPMWRDNAGTAYLDRYDQRASSVARMMPNTDFTGRALGVISALPAIPQVVGTLLPPVPSDTLAVAQVSLNGVARNSNAYKRLWPAWAGLDFQATGAILSNTWYANGSTGTRNMVRDMLPTAKGLGSAVDLMTKAGYVPWDPMNRAGPTFGKVEPDVVPPDRLR